MPEPNVLYEKDGAVTVITLNRPQYKNAQSYPLLDELDACFDEATADRDVKVVVVKGAGGNFSSGHDLGTPEQLEHRRAEGIPDSGIGYYDSFRHYNLDLTPKWRNLPKPTIAMVEGYCIFGGWMIAAAMDLVFASPKALFLAGMVEYFSIPWDINPRKAKEICFESRFISAKEAHRLGFVSRIYKDKRLEAETMAFAHRVAENGAMTLRMTKLAINKAMDMQGYSSAMESAFSDYMVMAANRGVARAEGTTRRLGGVDLALRGLRGQRHGQE
jgi:enoyl-CoA hydratase